MAERETPTPPAISAADLIVDEQGNLRFRNPELEAKLRESLGEVDLLAAASDTNYIGCGGNAYQCGKTALDEFESLINMSRNLAGRRG